MMKSSRVTESISSYLKGYRTPVNVMITAHGKADLVMPIPYLRSTLSVTKANYKSELCFASSGFKSSYKRLYSFWSVKKMSRVGVLLRERSIAY